MSRVAGGGVDSSPDPLEPVSGKPDRDPGYSVQRRRGGCGRGLFL